MHKHAANVAALLLSLLMAGCAQVMAYNQPGPIDRSVLAPGVRRDMIVGTLGAPVGTEAVTDFGRTETYKYTDGGKINSAGAKAGRIVLYTAGDIFACFLTQIIWIPIELALDGTDYMATVDYEADAENRLTATRILERKLEGDHSSRITERNDRSSRRKIGKTPGNRRREAEEDPIPEDTLERGE